MPYFQGLCLQTLILLPAMLLVSSVFYLLVEKPCMDKHWPEKAFRWLKSRLPAGSGHERPS